MSMRVAVILAGGSGERFWPLSTPERPKQLLKLADPDRTLLQEAIDRVEPLFGAENIFVATGPKIATAVRETGLLSEDNILVEPQPKNTLGALCWAVNELRKRGYGDDTTMAVLTADHAIPEADLFRSTVSQAVELAESTRGLVTIGIRPTRPETGYGYIRLGDEVEGGYKADQFAEKPPLETAQRYVESGDYVWNAGMFFWTISAFEGELAAHCPEASAIMSRLAEGFGELPSLPVDRAVMERSDKIYVVPARFDWDDVGSWDALERTRESDGKGNVLVGKVAELDTENCIAYSESVPIGLIGVRDIIVVSTATGVLVCHRSEAQRVREIVAKLNTVS